MTDKPKDPYAEPSAQSIAQLTPPMQDQQVSRCGLWRAALAVSVALVAFLLCRGVAAAQGNSPTQLRRFIDQQVGGIQKMMVPAHDTELPQPRLANGSPDPQFQTTEAKRYLGKLLFHDPARATKIIPEFGGILEHSGSASCGTCHLGEAASKSGTLLNLGFFAHPPKKGYSGDRAIETCVDVTQPG